MLILTAFMGALVIFLLATFMAPNAELNIEEEGDMRPLFQIRAGAEDRPATAATAEAPVAAAPAAEVASSDESTPDSEATPESAETAPESAEAAPESAEAAPESAEDDAPEQAAADAGEESSSKPSVTVRRVVPVGADAAQASAAATDAGPSTEDIAQSEEDERPLA